MLTDLFPYNVNGFNHFYFIKNEFVFGKEKCNKLI